MAKILRSALPAQREQLIHQFMFVSKKPFRFVKHPKWRPATLCIELGESQGRVRNKCGGQLRVLLSSLPFSHTSLLGLFIVRPREGQDSSIYYLNSAFISSLSTRDYSSIPHTLRSWGGGGGGGRPLCQGYTLRPRHKRDLGYQLLRRQKEASWGPLTSRKSMVLCLETKISIIHFQGS